MSPILQALVAVAVGVLLRMLFLSKVAFIVCCNSTHMVDIVLVVLGRVLLRILLEDLDDLPAAAHTSAHRLAELPQPHLSCPTLSPDPSLLDHPESLDPEPLSHFSSSSAVILTVLLKSLLGVSQMCGIRASVNPLDDIFLALHHLCAVHSNSKTKDFKVSGSWCSRRTIE